MLKYEVVEREKNKLRLLKQTTKNELNIKIFIIILIIFIIQYFEFFLTLKKFDISAF